MSGKHPPFQTPRPATFGKAAAEKEAPVTVKVTVVAAKAAVPTDASIGEEER